MELVLHGALSLNAQKYGDKEALVFGDERVSHVELNDRVNRLANGLLAAGMRPGDHCAVMSANSIEFVETLLALSSIGATFVCINTLLTAKEIHYIVEHSDSRGLIVEHEFADRVASVLDDLPALDAKLLFCIGGSHERFRPFEEAWSEDASSPGVEVAETSLMRLAYTSGTTGMPKAAMITHRSEVLMFFQFGVEFGLSDEDRMLIAGPMHAIGPFVFSLMALYFGQTLVLLRKFDAERVLQTITDEKITASFMVPTMYNLILAIPIEERRARYDVSSLRILASGSAPRHTRTRELMFEYFEGTNMFDGYGSTEGGLNTALKQRDQIRKITTVGQPVIGSEVKVVDPVTCEEVAVGEIGELWVRGLSLASGYYDNPEATAENFLEDGWFRTGDLGFLDDEHFFSLVDRKNDVIISGGTNVYPTEVEQVLYEHPKVHEAVVIGVPDPKWGEAVKARVVPKEGVEVTPEELAEFCRERLAGHKRPKTIDLVDQLPKNAAGKILRREVRAEFWAGQATAI